LPLINFSNSRTEYNIIE